MVGTHNQHNRYNIALMSLVHTSSLLHHLYLVRVGMDIVRSRTIKAIHQPSS